MKKFEQSSGSDLLTIVRCKKCVQLNTRPGVTFDEQGVCNVCRYYETKDDGIDWNARRKEFEEIAEWAKKKATTYDAVIPASGGKDSVRVALYARDELGLNCVLVRCEPYNITSIGRHNWENLVNKGFDAVTYTCNPVVVKELMKRAFYQYGHISKATDYPLYPIPIRFAMNYKIPLVVFGENSALELGDVVKDKSELGGDASGIANWNTIGGGDASVWAKEGITRKAIIPYQFPSKEEIEKAGVRLIFFSYYVKWSQYENAQFALKHGLKIRRDSRENLGRIHKWSCLDTDRHMVNQMLKFFKLGIGFATDEICYDIREGRLTRDKGLELLKAYDGRCADKYIQKFCDQIGITKKEFWRVASSFRNMDIWERDKTGKWVMKAIERNC